MRNLFIFLALVAVATFNARANNDAPQSFGSTVNTGSFTSSTVSTQALAQNLERVYLMIQNVGATAVTIKYGSAHSANEGIFIPGGASTIFEPHPAPINSVYIKGSANDLLYIVEGIR